MLSEAYSNFSAVDLSLLTSKTEVSLGNSKRA